MSIDVESVIPDGDLIFVPGVIGHRDDKKLKNWAQKCAHLPVRELIDKLGKVRVAQVSTVLCRLNRFMVKNQLGRPHGSDPVGEMGTHGQFLKARMKRGAGFFGIFLAAFAFGLA